MSVEANLAEVVAACRDKLTAQEGVDAAIRRRERATWRLVREDGLPMRTAHRLVLERLAAEGFTDEQIRGLGVSFQSMRDAVERPRG